MVNLRSQGIRAASREVVGPARTPASSQHSASHHSPVVRANPAVPAARDAPAQQNHDLTIEGLHARLDHMARDQEAQRLRLETLLNTLVGGQPQVPVDPVLPNVPAPAPAHSIPMSRARVNEGPRFNLAAHRREDSMEPSVTARDGGERYTPDRRYGEGERLPERQGRALDREDSYRRSRRDSDRESELALRGRTPRFNEDDIERRLRRIERRRRTNDSDSEEERGNPLAPHIVHFPNPEGFRYAPLSKYDGTSDPADHIYQFTTSMDAACAPDEVRCRLFPTTLTGIAAKWYCKLPAGRIGSWPALVGLFKRQFRVHHEKTQNAISLADIKQGEEESLREYVKRFNHAAARVKGATEQLMHYALIAGVRKGTAFAQKLVMKKTEDLEDFYEKAERYMRLEESEVEKPKPKILNTEEGSSGKKDEKNPQGNQGNKRGNNNNQGGQKKRRFGNGGEHPEKFTTYTALTGSRAEVFEATRDKVPYQRPPPRNPTEAEKKSGKYCRFHQIAGHDTDECRHLKDVIEKLIQDRNEHVTRFVRRPAEQGQQQLQHPGRTPAQPGLRIGMDGEGTSVQPANIRRVIDTICGGPHVIEGSRRAKEAFSVSLDNSLMKEGLILEARPGKQPRLDEEVVTFSRKDLEGTEYPHTDPLVISAVLGNDTVNRILVDNGSSVNVLFKRTFDRMGLLEEDVQPCNIPIHGFTGAGIVPTGTITLPLTVGTAPRAVTRMQEFLILDCPSAYNAFLGRPGLSALRATTAVWCLSMKFPTPHGTGVVRGDQGVSRRCYVTEVDYARKGHKGKSVEPEYCVKSVNL